MEAMGVIGNNKEKNIGNKWPTVEERKREQEKVSNYQTADIEKWFGPL